MREPFAQFPEPREQCDHGYDHHREAEAQEKTRAQIALAELLRYVEFGRGDAPGGTRRGRSGRLGGWAVGPPLEHSQFGIHTEPA